MEVRKEDFPVVVQAFETTGNSDVFIAEQVVNSQSDIDSFTSRYTGKLIKARRLTDVESNKQGVSNNNHSTQTKKKSSTGNYVLIIVLLIIVALLVVGFTTGWIQRTFNIQMNVLPFSFLWGS